MQQGGGTSVSRLQSVLDACSRFFESRLRCAIVAFAFTAALFAVAGAAWVPTGVNDDWALSNGLSGNWPGDWGLCLFLNAALTQLIYLLNTSVPGPNWYFILEGLTVYLAYFAIVYLALSRTPFPAACLLSMAVTVLVLPGSTCESNFTYVAGFASCAGGFALCCSLAQKRHGPALVVAGIALLACGAMWRWTMFLLCIPVFGIAALFIALNRGEDGAGAPARLARLWPFLVSVCVFGLLFAYNGSLWQGEWHDWVEFNDERSITSDYPHLSYKKAASELEALGVSENDYEMTRSWMTEDPEYFTVGKLKAINEVTVVDRLSASGIASSLAKYLSDLVTSPKLGFVLLVTLIYSCLCLRGRYRGMALALLACSLALTVGLTVLGRLPARVHYPLWAYAVAAIAACAQCASGAHAGAAHARPARKGQSAVSRACSVAMAAMPVIAIAFIAVTAMPHMRLDRVKAVFDESSFEPHGYVMDYIREHDDKIYLMSTPSNASLVFSSLMVQPFDADLIERTVPLGGWGARAPYALARNERIGMENPIKGLVENDRAVYVAPGPDTAERLKTYLREHYYPNAEFELVDELAAENTDTMYVYRFRQK